MKLLIWVQEGTWVNKLIIVTFCYQHNPKAGHRFGLNLPCDLGMKWYDDDSDMQGLNDPIISLITA